LISTLAYAGVTVYAPPPGLEPDPAYQVKVAGSSSFVYRLPVAAMTYFSYTWYKRRAEVEVTCAQAVETVVVRPSRLKIKPVVKGNVIRFRLNETARVSVEVNGDIRHPLLIFADGPEDSPPKPGPAGVRYFEGGKIHDAGRIDLKSGEMLYIAGGAVVHGSVYMDQAKGVRILGRGILLGSLHKKGETRMVEINRSQDVELDGIIIADSKHWTVPVIASDRVTLRNVKIVSGNDWDDGVDVVGSRDVTVDQCFIRTKDDCVAVKAGVDYFTKYQTQRDVRNVVVKNSVLWNAEWGNGLEIGFETRTENISGIRFLNLDLIHVEGPEGTFTIHNGDRATVSDVVYDDIRVEDSHGLLVDFQVLQSRYSKDKDRGQIQRVRFHNIRVTGKELPSRIQGFDVRHAVEGVEFDDFRVNGKRWRDEAGAQLKVEHASGVRFQ
jgi:hypothetical protein